MLAAPRRVRSVRRFYVLAAFALALSVFVASAAAARPCGKAVIDDWYDNGIVDRDWECGCLRDAIERLTDLRPPYSPAQDDMRRVLEVNQCEGSGQVTRESVPGGTPVGGSDESFGVGDDALPWEAIIVGGIAVGLAALVGVAVNRQRRQR